jgi:hypothetical protein
MKKFKVIVPRRIIVDEVATYYVHAIDENDAIDIIVAGEYDDVDYESVDSELVDEYFDQSEIKEILDEKV